MCTHDHIIQTLPKSIFVFLIFNFIITIKPFFISSGACNNFFLTTETSHSKPICELGIFFQNHSAIKSDSVCFETRVKEPLPLQAFSSTPTLVSFLHHWCILHHGLTTSSSLSLDCELIIYSGTDSNAPPNRNLSMFPRSQEPSSGSHLPHASSQVIGGHITLYCRFLI